MGMFVWSILGAFLGQVLFSEECNREDDCKDDAEGTYDDVAACEEGVLASEYIGSWEHEALFAVEGVHGVIIVNSELVFTWSQVLVNPSP